MAYSRAPFYFGVAVLSLVAGVLGWLAVLSLVVDVLKTVLTRWPSLAVCLYFSCLLCTTGWIAFSSESSSALATEDRRSMEASQCEETSTKIDKPAALASSGLALCLDLNFHGSWSFLAGCFAWVVWSLAGSPSLAVCLYFWCLLTVMGWIALSTESSSEEATEITTKADQLPQILREEHVEEQDVISDEACSDMPIVTEKSSSQATTKEGISQPSKSVATTMKTREERIGAMAKEMSPPDSFEPIGVSEASTEEASPPEAFEPIGVSEASTEETPIIAGVIPTAKEQRVRRRDRVKRSLTAILMSGGRGRQCFRPRS